jgi:hypothetical protein
VVEKLELIELCSYDDASVCEAWASELISLATSGGIESDTTVSDATRGVLALRVRDCEVYDSISADVVVALGRANCLSLISSYIAPCARH